MINQILYGIRPEASSLLNIQKCKAKILQRTLLLRIHNLNLVATNRPTCRFVIWTSPSSTPAASKCLSPTQKEVWGWWILMAPYLMRHPLSLTTNSNKKRGPETHKACQRNRLSSFSITWLTPGTFFASSSSPGINSYRSLQAVSFIYWPSRTFDWHEKT